MVRARAGVIAIGLALLALAVGCGGPAAPTSAPLTTTASPTHPGTTGPPKADKKAPKDFVALSDVDSTILQDIRYSTDHNFVGRPVSGYLQPLCILTRQAAQALHRVQDSARAKGYTLKMYDCYRPKRAGEDFVRWAKDLNDQTMKGEFYPDVDKSQLFNQGYVGGGTTSHSRGSTVDLTLVKLPPREQPAFEKGMPLVSCTAPVEQRFPDNTIDMGTGFDCFDSRSHTLDPRITGQPRANRQLLVQLMSGQGWVNYDREWWHFRFTGEPYPSTYFDFPVTRDALT